MPTPQAPGGHSPYNALQQVAGTAAVAIPQEHAGLRLWSFAIPTTDGTFAFTSPANINAQIVEVTFRRNGNAGHANDNYLLRNNGTTVCTLIPGAGARIVARATTLNATVVPAGATVQIGVTAGGTPGVDLVDGTLDVWWAAAP